MNKTFTQSRIITTDSAQQFLNGRQVITPDMFNTIRRQAPVIRLFEIDRILNGVKDSIDPKNICSIPNWNKSISYLFGDCDIWLITEKDINSTVKVFNRFTRMEEDFVITAPVSKEDDFKNPEIDKLLERLNGFKQDFSQIVMLLLIGFLKYLLYCVRNDQTPDQFVFHNLKLYAIEKYINMLLDLLNEKEMITGPVEKAVRKLESLINSFIPNCYPESEIAVLLEELLSIYHKIEWGNREYISSCNREPYDLIEILEINPQNIKRLKFLLQQFDFFLHHVYRPNWDEINSQLGELMPDESDWLAFYNGKTGAIFMLVDRIQKEYDQVSKKRYHIELLYQETLLHELIHSSLDLYPRNANGERAQNITKWKEGAYSEESLVNALLLAMYRLRGPLKYLNWSKYLRKRMSQQSFFYRNALDLEYSNGLHSSLEKLIEYKLQYQSPKG